MYFKGRIVRIVSLILLVVFAIPINVCASVLMPSDDLLNYQSEQQDAKIQSLLDERARLLCSLFNANSKEGKENINIKIAEVDKLLENSGAVFLSDSEAMRMIAEKENILATENSTREDIPTSSSNTWISVRSSYTYQGIKHNIQTLTAQPKSESSALCSNDDDTIKYTNQWQAGGQNILQSVANSIAGGLIGEMPGGSIAFAFLDAFGALNSAFTAESIVKLDSIQYTWAATVTASFKYVRLENEDDSAQWLSFVSTKAIVEVGYQTSGFKYIPAGGTDFVKPEVSQGVRTIQATPSKYNNNNLAVKSYYTYGGGAWQECVQSVRISGPESKYIHNIVLCCPFLPSQCE